MKRTLKFAAMLLMVAATAFGLNKELKAQSKGMENGHEWVDLGLPSGTLWATTNVGADSPEAYGDYFAWGETKPQASNKYNSESYKYFNGYKVAKYNNNVEYGKIDNLTVLQPDDDAATANWGGAWRMPTAEELNELYDNCINKTAMQNGIYGQRFTAQNGNSIFLPSAGYRSDGELIRTGSHGCYWSSSLCGPRLACDLIFMTGPFTSSADPRNCSDRDRGFTVRPVCAPQK